MFGAPGSAPIGWKSTPAARNTLPFWQRAQVEKKYSQIANSNMALKLAGHSTQVEITIKLTWRSEESE